MTTTTDEALAGVLATLQAEGARLDARLAELEREREPLLDARKRVTRTITVLTGEPGKKPGPKPGKFRRRTQADVDRFVAYLTAHQAEYPEGFGPSNLRNSNGHGLSYDSLRRVLGELHDRGVIRLDHKGVAGARFYKLVGGTSG